ncbi:NAD(P)-dependent alcohol dehydrogenase [Micrococcus luteus]|uniref:NAD(P)-dependent alcohol dehydrogenase n=1 Tax=Micrococcus TaxID=1269 RepID=UPI001F4892BC|nr:MULTISPECIES: NAD(P)-dependent alcohol dehydrogenase [Micrococcus]MCV7501899.1 NAD(P)-dependent alcohol dehydrogenase [Micrococcus luteus]MCV7558150.1 NAD(P)-dependent alcohol dehydrogenase [Micrococcus luteus]
MRRPGEVAVEERPVPSPGPGEVLVRVTAVGVCGSDTHYFEHGRIGDFVVDAPLVLGHEPAGCIVAVGAGVDPARVGERVSLEPGIPEAFSAQTLAGRYNLDPAVRFFATPPVDGAFAEYVCHPAAFSHRVPDTLSDEAAALLEPLSVAIAAVRAGDVGLGSRVLVAGAGPIGLLAAACAARAGALATVVTDVRPERLEQARRHGATDVFTAQDAPAVADDLPGGGYTVFIDATGAEAAVLDGLRRLAPAGRAVLVGMGADTISLPVPLVQGRELTVTGTFRYAGTWPTAIALAASGAVDLDGLVTSRHRLDDVAGALTAARAPGAVKAVVRP